VWKKGKGQGREKGKEGKGWGKGSQWWEKWRVKDGKKGRSMVGIRGSVKGRKREGGSKGRGSSGKKGRVKDGKKGEC
jgi:hypothetical protein